MFQRLAVRRLVLLGALLVGAVAAAPAGAASAKHKPKPCERTGSTTIVRNSLVRVYETRDADFNSSNHLTIYGCSLRNGKRMKIAGYVNSGGSTADEPRPTIWLNREAVAANNPFCPPTGDPCTGRVGSFDVHRRVKKYLEDVPGGIAVQLVLKPNASFAYIAGDGTVRKADADGIAQLDPGPAIENGSLALAGSIVYWTKAGQPFSARLN
jgi:hypothetical protein